MLTTMKPASGTTYDKKSLIIYGVVELDLIGNDDVDGHNHLVISD